MPYLNKGKEDLIKKAIEKLSKHVYHKVGELKVTAWRTKEPVTYQERKTGDQLNLKIGDQWGDIFDCAWFLFEGEIPHEAKDKHVVLQLDVSGELCVFDENGCPNEGLTSVHSSYEFVLGHPGKTVYHFTDCAKDGEKIALWADAGCNDLFGKMINAGKLEQAEIAVCNDAHRNLFFEACLLYDFWEHGDKNSARVAKIFEVLFRAASCLRAYSTDEVLKASAILAKELKRKNGGYPLKVTAIGHAHLDLAWLWPIRETKRKAARTFSTAIKNIERYPGYTFGASQPQLYGWIKEEHPALYEKIKEKVKEGTWETQGAMWVEPDTNVTGAESLVRQILYGKRFFKQEFDQDIKVLFLPDVFGYSGALPQLLAKSDVPYFMTQKLCWNDYNTHPHHTFIWKGIDGTGVLAHMLPENTYNGTGQPRSLVAIEKNFLDKAVCDECLMLYGIGDGGGGPGQEHIESIIRSKNLMGLPPVTLGTSIDFFRRQEKVRKDLCEWKGELYLEKHQGTYTTQGKVKYYNQKMEKDLRELELALERLSLLDKNMAYPQTELEEIWKEVLLYQFHDIIPGSSIDRVYDECHARYEVLCEIVNQMIEQTYEKIAALQDAEDAEWFMVNPLNWERNGWAQVNGEWKYISVDSMGLQPLNALDKKIKIKVEKNLIENENIRVRFREDGSISSIYDKNSKKEALDGTGNCLSVYCDDGDCWDIDYQSREPYGLELESTKAYIDGPRAIMENRYRFGESTLVQKVILTDDGKRVDFETFVDWKETHKMLRTSFPIAVTANDAVCGIQFGEIKRSTSSNTSLEAAQTEICAQRWIDLSQPDYGATVITDCKYGFKAKDNVVDINLLRSATYPGETADKGEHQFTYSFYPHNGDHIAAGSARAMYELNYPVRFIKAGKGALKAQASFLQIDQKNIIVEAVKKAEDSDDMIIRMYESEGKTTTTQIKLGFDYQKVEYVNLMETVEKTADLNKVQFKPFEIVTLKISK